MRLRAAAEPLDDEQVRQFAATLADSRVIGLGEPTHGSRPVRTLHTRLLRELITAHGLRAIAFETHAVRAGALDSYVRPDSTPVEHGDASSNDGRPGAFTDADRPADAVDALDRLSYWIWTVESIRSFLDWVRAFNADRPPGDRVSIHGIDTGNGPAEAAAVREAVEGLPARHRATLDRAVETGELPEPDSQPLEALRGRVRGGSRRLRRRARLFEQTVGVVTGADSREQAMCENVSWLAAQHGQLAVCGHNGHLLDATVGGIGRTTGSLLRERFGSRYTVVGFEFGDGTARAVDPSDERLAAVELPPVEGTLPAALRATGVARCRVDTAAVARLDQPWHLRRVGATFDPGWDREPYHMQVTPREACDWLVYCPTSEPTQYVGG